MVDAEFETHGDTPQSGAGDNRGRPHHRWRLAAAAGLSCTHHPRVAQPDERSIWVPDLTQQVKEHKGLRVDPEPGPTQ